MIEEKKNLQPNNGEEKEIINGKPVKGVQIVCTKHGLINQGSYFVRYSTYKKDPEDEKKIIEVDNSNIFCMACLNEVYHHFQEQGLVGEIQLKVDFEEDEKSLRPSEIREKSSEEKEE